jgi:excisionase family DNA binding protein
MLTTENQTVNPIPTSTPTQSPDRLLTVEEIAARLGVHRRTVFNRLKRENYAGVQKIGRRFYIHPSDLGRLSLRG